MTSGVESLAIGKTGRLRAAIAALAVGCAVAASAPAMADTSVNNPRVNIVRTGSLTKTSDLDFGFVVPGTVASFIRIPASSDTVVRDSGNAVLAGGSTTRAGFFATTLPLNLVTIQLPTTATMTRVGGTETIPLDQFTHSLTGGVTIPLVGTAYNVLNNGTLQFYVGARMRVVPGQAQGQYRGTFNVTANYL